MHERTSFLKHSAIEGKFSTSTQIDAHDKDLRSHYLTQIRHQKSAWCLNETTGRLNRQELQNTAEAFSVNFGCAVGS